MNGNYKKVANAKELEEALLNEQIQIIELVNDIDLGYQSIKNEIQTDIIFQEHNKPLTHPKLKETGVSKLRIENKDGLIIYSNNGSKILHCNIRIENSKNIKIDNLSFSELWEWDEETEAEYDRNDWDYITIENSENICISHCEFSKAYDGITDIKNTKNVTIEYCKLNEMDIEDEFYGMQFQELEKHKETYPMYKFLRDEMKIEYDDVKELCAYQFKVYTIGLEENKKEKCTNIVIHDSMYLNAKTRIPMIRDGNAYVYNIYADSRKITDMLKELKKEKKYRKIKNKYSKIVALDTYGIIATEKAYVLAENINLQGAKYPTVKYKMNRWEGFGNIKTDNQKESVDNLRSYLDKIVGIKNRI